MATKETTITGGIQLKDGGLQSGYQDIPETAVQTTTPVQEVGVISSRQGLDEVKRSQEQLSSLRPDKETAQAELKRIEEEAKKAQEGIDKLRQTEAEPTTSTFVNQETGQEITKSGEMTKDERDRLEAQGFALSDTTDTSSPELDKIKGEVADAKNTYNDVISRLEGTAIGNDALKQKIRSIREKYAARVKQMERVNERRYKSLKTLGIRLGSRYSGGSGGVFGSILSEEERQGLSRIFAIEAEMEGAIVNAEQAARDHNFTVYTELVDEAQKQYDKKVAEMQKLEKAAEEATVKAEEEAVRIEQQANVVEQVNLGVTSPFEIFKALDGNVPFDLIKEMTEGLPGAEGDEFEFKTGSSYQPAGTFNKTTGEFIPLVGATMLSSGNSIAGTGGVGINDFPTNADLDRMNTEERDFVNKVMRQLPTKLKDSEQEKKDRMKEALFDYRRGRGIQEVVDELNGFVVADASGQALANVFRSYAVGSGVDLAEISAAINNNNPEQAMTTIENAKLADAEQFFGNTDEARNVVKLSDTILRLVDEVPVDKLGAFDGRKFKIDRFAGLTNTEMQKVQQLETALATLNSPVRVSLIGTAGTEQEMAKITALQADILDQPEIIKTIVNTFRDGVVDIHNEARSQRGLPTVNKNQLISNEERLNLYKNKAGQAAEVQYSAYSNQDLFDSLPGTSLNMDSTDELWSTIGLSSS